MTVERTRESAARRASRASFAAAAAVALYTSAAFGGLLYAGLSAPVSCLLAAACGIIVSFIAAKVVLRNEVRERQRLFALAQLESARDRAQLKPEAKPAPKPAPKPAAKPAPVQPTPAIERREVRESREIQNALLPSEVPFIEGYHVEVDYQPCGALGGDFYDFSAHDDGRLLLTLGDVSGKGPAGAIVMAMVQTLFRQNADSISGPADLLRRVNDGFAGTLGKGIFVTALAGLLDPVHHRLTLAGAGHHPVLLMNPTARRTTRVGARGLALGLVTGEGYVNSLVETTIDLAPGDTLLLYTDGATDSVADLSADVGEHRLVAAAAAAILPGPHGALNRLRDDLWDGGGRRDDITMMLVTRLGAPATGRMAAADRNAQDATV